MYCNVVITVVLFSILNDTNTLYMSKTLTLIHTTTTMVFVVMRSILQLVSMF